MLSKLIELFCVYTTEDATIEFLEILKISPLVLLDATSSMLNLCFL